MRLALLGALCLLMTAPMTLAQPCNTAADADCDGIVNITELMNYIDIWYGCSACAPNLLGAINAYYAASRSLIYFEPPTPVNGVNQYEAYMNVTMNIAGGHYAFIDWDDSLIGWWRAENGAVDELDRNNGTFVGNTKTSPGKFGKAFEFDGNMDYVEIKDSPSLNFSGDFTISLWVYPKRPLDYLFSKGMNINVHYQGNRWQFDLRDGPNSVYLYYANTSPIINSWTHLVVGYDSSEKEIFMYVNGVFVHNSYDFKELDKYSSSGNIYIGTSDSDKGWRWLNGSIDEVMIFNRVVSEKEIQVLYNAKNSRLENDFTGEQGTKSFQAYAIDPVGEKSETETRTAYLSQALEKPKITLLHPFDDAWYGDSGLSFSFIVNTSLDTDFDCDIIIDGQTMKSVDVENNIRVSENVPVSNGINEWKVHCRDTSGNTGTSETRIFHVNTASPSIIINSPDSDIWNSKDVPFDIDFSGNDVYGFIDWNNSLVGWFRAEDKALDESGRNNHCTFNGNVTTALGKFGRTFNFDGNDSYISCFDTTHPDFQFKDNDSFTLSAWVYKLNGRTSEGTIIDKGCGSPTGYYLFYHGAGRYQINMGEGTGFVSVYASDTSPENKWTHVAVVYDSANKNLTIYLNGRRYMSSYASRCADTYSVYNYLNIGTNCYGGNDWNGSIDEMMFFRRALTPEEIKSLYNDTDLMNVFPDNEEFSDTSYKVYALDSLGTKKEVEKSIKIDAPNTPPAVILKKPLNQTRSPDNNMDFECDIRNTNENSQLASVTFYWDYGGSFRAEETKTISGQNAGATFTKTGLSVGVIHWVCFACDTRGNCGFAKDNNYLFIGNNDFYVAKTGNDNNPGTLAEPFLTVKKCADIALPGDTCYIREGIYRETITPKNSGNEFASITFRPYSNEEVTVSGADEVTGWTQHSGSIYKATMKWDLGWAENQVFVDGKMMFLARWPNTPSLDVMRPITYLIESGTDLGNLRFDLYNSNLTQPAGYWNNALIHISSGSAYWTYTGTVDSSEAGKLIFNSHGNSGMSYSRGKFYLLGVYNALDSEGEWYYDNVTKELYLWAPGGGNPEGKVEAKARDYAFDLSGKSYINLEGLNIFSAGIITDEKSHNIIMDSLNATYVSHDMYLARNLPNPGYKYGILLDGYDNLLNSSHVQYSSCNGVSMKGRRNTVSYSEIHDVDYMGTICATISTVGMRTTDMVVTHNKLYNSGRDVFLHTGSQNLKLMYNEIFGTNVGGLTYDLGVTYASGTDYNGTEIAYNVIHGSDYAGIYLDAWGWNANIHHNLVYGDMPYDGILISGPRGGYTVEHNTVDSFHTSTGGVPQEGGPEKCIIYRNNIFTKAVEKFMCSYFQNNIYQYADPLFVDKANLNYHLKAGSPAIDAGLQLGYSHDIEGNLIIGAPDIGAYEYGG